MSMPSARQLSVLRKLLLLSLRSYRLSEKLGKRQMVMKSAKMYTLASLLLALSLLAWGLSLVRSLSHHCRYMWQLLSSVCWFSFTRSPYEGIHHELRMVRQSCKCWCETCDSRWFKHASDGTHCVISEMDACLRRLCNRCAHPMGDRRI